MAHDWQRVFDLGDGAPPADAADAAAAAEETGGGGFFRRLREGLSRSRQALQAELSASIFDQLDSATWERLEEALILADVGAPTTAEVVGRLESEVESGRLADGEEVRERLIELMAELAGSDDGRIDL